MTTISDSLNDTVVRAYDEGFPLLMPRWGYVASAFILFLIGFFGFFLNLMVILLMFKDRQLWTPLNMILFNLVCSDFSVSLLGNPFTLISALFHRWIFGKTMCVLYGFFMALLGITSITTLTVLSFERYMMVTRPLSSRHLSSKGAVMSIIFIWSYSLALTTPPLLGWGNYVNEAANISCSVNWHEQSMNTLTYILFLFAMGQIVPFAIISFSYINIIRTIKQNSQRTGRVGRAEAKVTAMVFVMIVAFTVAWTPYSVFALVEQFADKGVISPGVGVIPALVAKSSICYDPLIYIGMNTQFRQSIRRLFGIHTKSGLSQTEKGYDNTIMSPAHRFSRINDMTTKFNSSESSISMIVKKTNSSVKQDKKTTTTNEYCEMTKDVGKPFNQNLCTIQENKTASDNERSGETVYDEDSSGDKPKLKMFGASCKFYSDTSPVLTILDSDRLVFSKVPLVTHEDEVDDMLENVYNNKAFEDHAGDVPNKSSVKMMQAVCSVDVGAANEGKLKLTHEVKLESLLNGAVSTNFIEQEIKTGQDTYNTYLYMVDNNDIGEDNYVV